MNSLTENQIFLIKQCLTAEMKRLYEIAAFNEKCASDEKRSNEWREAHCQFANTANKRAFKLEKILDSL